MLSAKQWNYWYHFHNVWYDTFLDRGFNLGPPALEASTLPLGYQAGGIVVSETLYVY